MSNLTAPLSSRRGSIASNVYQTKLPFTCFLNRHGKRYAVARLTLPSNPCLFFLFRSRRLLHIFEIRAENLLAR